jgi:hypothetical protein
MKHITTVTFIHSIVCLTIGLEPLPNRVLHKVRSNDFFFNFQYPIISLKSSTISLRFRPLLPSNAILLSFLPSVFQKAVPMQDVTNQDTLPFNYNNDIPSSVDLSNIP